MARPFKSGVDYFPLDVKMDDEIFLLEAEHDITGFGVLIKLYQRIYASNYWLKWDKKELIVFSKAVNVDKNEVVAIINTCLEWDLFHKNLFEEYLILTSHGIQERFFEIVKRRTQVEIIKEFLLLEVPEREKQLIVIVDINSINDCKSTQSKVEESREEENIEDSSIPQNEFAGDDQKEFYLTKKKRKLTGKRLATFNLFWSAFDYKKGKADAADSWLDIPQLTDKLVNEICESAKIESSNRGKLISDGRTPIFPQGWLTARRWEDESVALSGNQNGKPEPQTLMEKYGNQKNDIEVTDYEIS